MAIPWSHDSSRLLRRPLPLPTPAPQIRLVFVRRTQCEKMSPRGRAPWPLSLTTGALNHWASFLPSLPPRQLGELGEQAAVRVGVASYHLLALSSLPAIGSALFPPPISCSQLILSLHQNLSRPLYQRTRKGLGESSGKCCIRKLYGSFEKCDNKRKK